MAATAAGHMNGRVMTVAGWRGSHGHWCARGCLCAVKQAASVRGSTHGGARLTGAAKAIARRLAGWRAAHATVVAESSGSRLGFDQRHGRGDGCGARCTRLWWQRAAARDWASVRGTTEVMVVVLGLGEWYGTVQGLCMGLLAWIEESKGCETQSSNNKLEDEMYKAESPTYLNVG
ncbi:WG repeat-containing protein [Sesbania bispinosa]|nr:WG repeat-containing protein [Sesbania bispinosa]